MAVFRVERNTGYTVMSNHHLRNKELTLKAKGLLSQMLSLPEDWDYTLAGLSHINREKIDAIREAVKELEKAGYIVRSRERDEKGRLRGADYVIYEQPQPREPEAATSGEQPPILDYEATHDYDEYHFDLDDIEHDPYVLISILSALHEGEWTLSEVQGTLDMLFEKQYILTEEVIVETRYRTETRTGTRTVTDPDTGESYEEEYEYTVQVPYSYYI